MTNALLAYLNLTPAQRGQVLEQLRIHECEWLEIADEEVTGSDREIFGRTNAEAYAAAQRLLEDANKLCYQPPGTAKLAADLAANHGIPAARRPK